MARGGGNGRGGRGRGSVQSCSSIGRGVIGAEYMSRDTHLAADLGDQIPLTTDEQTESSQQPNRRADYSLPWPPLKFFFSPFPTSAATVFCLHLEPLRTSNFTSLTESKCSVGFGYVSS